MGQDPHVEVTGQPTEVGPLPPTCGSQELNSDHQAWQHTLRRDVFQEPIGWVKAQLVPNLSPTVFSPIHACIHLTHKSGTPRAC